MRHTEPEIVVLDETPDAWHMHTPQEGPPQPEHGARTDPGALITAFVAMVAFLAAVAVLCVIYFERRVTQLRQERIETTVLAADYLKYRDQARQRLESYGWWDAQAAREGRLSVPLDKAVERVLAQYRVQDGTVIEERVQR